VSLLVDTINKKLYIVFMKKRVYKITTRFADGNQKCYTYVAASANEARQLILGDLQMNEKILEIEVCK